MWAGYFTIHGNMPHKTDPFGKCEAIKRWWEPRGGMTSGAAERYESLHDRIRPWSYAENTQLGKEPPEWTCPF